MNDTPTPSPTPTPKSAAIGYRLSVERGKTVARFALAAGMLLLVHAVLTVYHYKVAEIAWIPWRQLFDVDAENNLPTWFSGLLLGVTAFWVWLLADAKRAEHDRWALHWRVLAIGFFVMSLDEVAGLHESINTVSDVTWAIPGGILVMVIGLSYFPFLWSLPKATRNAFTLAGCLYVAGAVGVEMIGAPMVEDAMPYNLVTVAEEGLEMGGVIIFLSALLQSMARQCRGSDQVAVTVTITD
jgi:hypothetical protein